MCPLSASGVLLLAKGLLLQVGCAHSSAAPSAPAQQIWPAGKSQEDADADGISDDYEMQVAARFRPLFFLNADGVYQPASVQFFIEHSAVVSGGQPAHGPSSLEEALKFIMGKDSSGFRLEPRPRFDPEHSDAEAKRERVTVFFRVFRPDPATFAFKPEDGCEYVSIQYYFFSFFNDADFPLNGGDHDGDWGCVDLTVITKAPAGHAAAAANHDQPVPHSAIFHNHGRQLFVDAIHHRKLSFATDGRLQIYLEHNSNEPWPAAGKSGFGGWSPPPGFLVNRRFEKSTGIDFPWSPREERIARDHNQGPQVAEYNLLNLGERDHPMPQMLARFLMTFAGKFGNYSPTPKDYAPVLKVFDVPENNPPEGPAFQTKMWDRKFEGAALPFKGEDGWLEWRGGDAPVKAKESPK